MKNTVTSFDVTEPNRVDTILEVLRQGIRHSDHKCAKVGAAAITFADGQTITIDILPGHTADNYEFRYKGCNYFVPRDAFLIALKNAGIDTELLPAPRSDKE